MDGPIRLLVWATQALVMAGAILALGSVRHCMATRRRAWFFWGLYSWAGFGAVLGIAQIVVIVIGCPPLPVMRILLWLDRTVLLTGYLAIVVSCYQMQKTRQSGGQ